MEEGIAIAQRSNFVSVDVEFTEGYESEITDDKDELFPSPNASSYR